MEFRRAPHLVLYWNDELLVLKNYATGRSIKADPFILQILEQFGGWRSREQYLDAVPEEARSSASRVIDLLHRHRWLRRRDDAPHEAEERFDEWAGWNPAAGLFHSATRNQRFMQLDELIDQLAVQAAAHRDGVQRRDRAESTQRHADVPLLGGHDANRRLLVWTPPEAAAEAALGLLGRGAEVVIPDQAGAAGHQQGTHHPLPQTRTAPRGWLWTGVIGVDV